MRLFASDFCAWAPGISSKEEWHKWKEGCLTIKNESTSPSLSFVDSLFKRRLSQITRMTIQVIHDLIETRKDCIEAKTVFVSFRGEINRQFSINRMLIEENEVLPASFSLSVFNTPPAAASIALQMKGGYSVIYPSQKSFRSSLLASCSPILCGDEEKIVFVYADEKIPEEYSTLSRKEEEPLAYACVISSKEKGDGKELLLDDLPFLPKTFLMEGII